MAYSPNDDMVKGCCSAPARFRWAMYLDEFREFPSVVRMLFLRKEEFGVTKIPDSLRKILGEEFPMVYCGSFSGEVPAK